MENYKKFQDACEEFEKVFNEKFKGSVSGEGEEIKRQFDSIVDEVFREVYNSSWKEDNTNDHRSILGKYLNKLISNRKEQSQSSKVKNGEVNINPIELGKLETVVHGNADLEIEKFNLIDGGVLDLLKELYESNKGVFHQI